MKLSRYGQLAQKADRSGINGNPVITDGELKELFELLIELVKVAADLNDGPLQFVLQMDLERLEKVIGHRNE